MELAKFIENLVLVFEEADPKTIKPEAKFRDLEGYTSLVSLSIIAMVDREYHVKLKGEDLRKAKTIEDLFDLIKVKD
jgi:acyl carrier protein